jgi:hypothetical protein
MPHSRTACTCREIAGFARLTLVLYVRQTLPRFCDAARQAPSRCFHILEDRLSCECWANDCAETKSCSQPESLASLLALHLPRSSSPAKGLAEISMG